MRLEGIVVRRLHDLGPFAVEDLAPGLNLLVGPNGSGKTSVMAAVRAVLWGTPELPLADLDTVWADGEDAWRAALVGGAARWQQRGVDVPAPEVPDAALSASWAVGLRELLTAGDTEDNLLDRVRTQMAGGYDLPSVLAGYPPKRRIGHGEQKALRAARDRLRGVEGRRRDLLGEEDGLAERRRRLEKALKAQSDVRLLDDALALVDARSELARAEAEVASFAEGIEVATPDAQKRLEDWRRAMASAEEARDAARRDLEQALDKARSTGLEAPLDEADIATAKALTHRVRDRAREAAQARGEADAARAVAETAGRALAPELDPAGAGAVSPDLDAVEKWAEAVLRARAGLEAAETRAGAVRSQLEALGPVPDADEAERLGRAQMRLEDALGQGAGGRTPRWVVPLAVVLAVAGVVLAVLVRPWLAAVTGLGVGLLAARLFVRRAPRVAGPGAGWPQGVDEPRSWDAEGVHAALKPLRARLAAAREARSLEDALRLLAQERARHQAALEAQQAERSTLLGGLEIDPQAGDLRLADLLRRLGEWRAASREAVARAAEAKGAGDRLAEATAALEAALARLGMEAASPDEVEVRLDALASRSRDLREARAAEAQATRRLADEAKRIETLEAQTAALLAEAGLGSLSRDRAQVAFEDKVAQRGAWTAAVEAARLLAHRVREREEALRGHEALLALDREALTVRRADAGEQAGHLDGLREEITRTEVALENERRSLDYEDALAAVTAAEQALAEVRDGALHAAAARLLLEEVRAAHAEQQLPAVFQRARALFGRFTRGRYDLTLGGLAGDALELRAVDTAAPGGAGLSLEALSDGTRMQLLLATRVAFATGEEHGRPLPLFLDESLTATDPVRFGAVADAVLELTGDGRQVFYLTSDPADVARWQQACARRGAPAPKVVDLAEVRQLAGALDADALALPATPAVPAPDGLDAAEYGRRLGVPRFDPFAGGDSVDLFHLLRDDLPLIERLRREGRVTRLGPLRRVLALDGTGLLTGAERARVEALGEVARAFAEAWRVGRGRPVDRAALEASEAVSDTFLDRVTEVACELGGNAADLLAAFEARSDERLKGFRASALEKLEAYLRDEGYLDPRPRLPAAEILARCRAAVSDALGRGVLGADDVTRVVQALDAATGALASGQ